LLERILILTLKMSVKILTYPRSGSRFTARLLKGLGVKVEQEHLGEEGTVSWRHAVEPYDAEVVLHQVRNPLAAITSTSTASARSLKYIAKNTGLQWTGDDVLRFCLRTYPLWHKLIENHHPQWRYQIESLNQPEIWEEFCSRLQISGEWVEMGAAARHSRAAQYGEVCTWEQLMDLDGEATRQVRELSKEYGYE